MRTYVNANAINRLQPGWFAGRQQTAPRGEACRILIPAHRLAENLALAQRALKQRRFAAAETLLHQAIDHDPGSPEAHTLLGVLHEGLGEHHAAYHSYHRALTHDRHYGPARDGLKRYCERFGFDFHNKVINPGAD